MQKQRIKLVLSFVLLALVVSAVSIIASRRLHRFDAYRYRLPVNTATVSLDSYEKQLLKLLEAKPDNFMDWNSLADVQMSQGKRTGDQTKFDAAVVSANKSLSIIHTRNAAAELVLAHIMENQHLFAQAIAAAKDILERNPNSIGPYSILVTSYLATGDLAQAQVFADKFVERSPKIGPMALRGLVLISAGRESEGIFDLKKSFAVEDINEEGDSTWARSILARYFLQRGRLAEAENLVNEALRITPGFPLALDVKAQVLAHKGDIHAAEELFDQAFSQSRQVVYLRHAAELDLMTDRAQLANDRWTQAEKFIRLDLDKGLYGHRLELAKILLKRQAPGDLMEAAVLCQTEVKLRQSADMYFVMASIQFTMKDVKAARETLAKALRLGAHEARIYNLAAEINASLGLAARSAMYHDLALETDSSYDPLKTFL